MAIFNITSMKETGCVRATHLVPQHAWEPETHFCPPSSTKFLDSSTRPYTMEGRGWCLSATPPWLGTCVQTRYSIDPE
jgi:hypothetical protein